MGLKRSVHGAVVFRRVLCTIPHYWAFLKVEVGRLQDLVASRNRSGAEGFRVLRASGSEKV